MSARRIPCPNLNDLQALFEGTRASRTILVVGRDGCHFSLSTVRAANAAGQVVREATLTTSYDALKAFSASASGSARPAVERFLTLATEVPYVALMNEDGSVLCSKGGQLSVSQLEFLLNNGRFDSRRIVRTHSDSDAADDMFASSDDDET